MKIGYWYAVMFVGVLSILFRTGGKGVPLFRWLITVGFCFLFGYFFFFYGAVGGLDEKHFRT